MLACFSSEQNGNHLYEMDKGDSSMEDEDLQAKEIKEDSEEVAGFEINEKCTKMISIH